MCVFGVFLLPLHVTILSLDFIFKREEEGGNREILISLDLSEEVWFMQRTVQVLKLINQ